MSRTVDKAGTWLVNIASFPMHDPQSNTTFAPGEPTKAALTQFVRDQPTIVRCANPSDDLTPKEQEKLDGQIKADEEERLAREAAAEETMRMSAALNNTHGAVAAAKAPPAPAEGE